jgi:hypothetical protein
MESIVAASYQKHILGGDCAAACVAGKGLEVDSDVF